MIQIQRKYAFIKEPPTGDGSCESFSGFVIDENFIVTSLFVGDVHWSSCIFPSASFDPSLRMGGLHLFLGFQKDAYF